ncbi:MAG: sulfite oxidase [Cyclobacteriaceae bacterium]|nr:sulfite oxidase [Cyclobacteriaceae bacterium]
MEKEEKGIHALYAADPIAADKRLWGRVADPHTRRGFLKKSGLAAMAVALGAEIVFADKMPSGLIPAGLANNDEWYKLFGKDKDLIVLNDRPWNVETPPHLLDDVVTPASRFFMRNNGIMPEAPDAKNWKITIEGEAVKTPVEISLNDLKEKFKHHTYQLTIECGGNGRAEFYPPAKGNQWSLGAVACAEWTGVRVRDVLESVGITDQAVYLAYYAADKHLSGDPDKVVISRGVPMSKAMEDETLLAFKMNGEDIPLAHGYPVRLVAGGWPGSVSGKWVEKLSVRNIVHDGPKMTGDAYRVPCKPVPPGSEVNPEDMCIIESMPVKSLITYPKSGAIIEEGRKLEVRGHAWAGDLEVSKMEYSIDFGASWKRCELKAPANRLAWQRFNTTIDFPGKGYYEVWARATDSKEAMQPMVIPGWNPKGYLNNACHRIAVKVV